jgi:hypothetical protein
MDCLVLHVLTCRHAARSCSSLHCIAPREALLTSYLYYFHNRDDLDADLIVADVFIDNGKGQRHTTTDGLTKEQQSELFRSIPAKTVNVTSSGL